MASSATSSTISWSTRTNWAASSRERFLIARSTSSLLPSRLFLITFQWQSAKTPKNSLDYYLSWQLSSLKPFNKKRRLCWRTPLWNSMSLLKLSQTSSGLTLRISIKPSSQSSNTKTSLTIRSATSPWSLSSQSLSVNHPLPRKMTNLSGIFLS